MTDKKRISEINVAEDGWDAMDEIHNDLENIEKGVLIEAARLAHQDRHGYVDRTYVRKASRHMKLPSNSTITWFLRVIVPLAIALAIFQMGSLISLSLWHQPLLWILPFFTIFFAVGVAFAFREFL